MKRQRNAPTLDGLVLRFWVRGWIKAQTKAQPCGLRRRERIQAKALHAVARHKAWWESQNAKSQRPTEAAEKVSK